MTEDEKERSMRVLRTLYDDKLVASFEFMGLKLVDMDRRELLAVICLLATQSKAFAGK